MFQKKTQNLMHHNFAAVNHRVIQFFTKIFRK